MKLVSIQMTRSALAPSHTLNTSVYCSICTCVTSSQVKFARGWSLNWETTIVWSMTNFPVPKSVSDKILSSGGGANEPLFDSLWMIKPAVIVCLYFIFIFNRGNENVHPNSTSIFTFGNIVLKAQKMNCQSE